LSLEFEFIECKLILKNLKHKQEYHSSNILKVRYECINKCDELLRKAQRLKKPNLIEFGSKIQWNFCLPLLQYKLRKSIRKQLQLIADCLETVNRFID
jgi:hypothetical protein